MFLSSLSCIGSSGRLCRKKFPQVLSKSEEASPHRSTAHSRYHVSLEKGYIVHFKASNGYVGPLKRYIRFFLYLFIENKKFSFNDFWLFQRSLSYIGSSGTLNENSVSLRRIWTKLRGILPTNLPIRSDCLSICLFVCLSGCLPVCLCVCPSVYIYIYTYIYTYMHTH